MKQTSKALAEDETAKAHYLLPAYMILYVMTPILTAQEGSSLLAATQPVIFALCALRMNRSRDAMSEFEAALQQEPGNKEIKVKLEPPGGRRSAACRPGSAPGDGRKWRKGAGYAEPNRMRASGTERRVRRNWWQGPCHEDLLAATVECQDVALARWPPWQHELR